MLTSEKTFTVFEITGWRYDVVPLGIEVPT
jgi:hypothetical protein